MKFLPDPAGNQLMPWSRRFDCLLPLALLPLIQRVIKMIPPPPKAPRQQGGSVQPSRQPRLRQ